MRSILITILCCALALAYDDGRANSGSVLNSALGCWFLADCVQLNPTSPNWLSSQFLSLSPPHHRHGPIRSIADITVSFAPGCASPDLRIQWEADVVDGGPIPGGFPGEVFKERVGWAVNATNAVYNFTIYNPAVVAGFNQYPCWPSPWVVGESKDIHGINCGPNPVTCVIWDLLAMRHFSHHLVQLTVGDIGPPCDITQATNNTASWWTNNVCCEN